MSVIRTPDTRTLLIYIRTYIAALKGVHITDLHCIINIVCYNIRFSAKTGSCKEWGKSKFQSHIFNRARNAHLRNVNIYYQSQFFCSICKDQPNVIFMDGIVMGTTNPIAQPQVDETQR